MLRPAVAVVHCARSGQSAQTAPKAALRAPSPIPRIGAVLPAGQLTVSASRSMLKASLVNNPPAAWGFWVLHLDSTPARARRSCNSPVPYAQSPKATGRSSAPQRWAATGSPTAGSRSSTSSGSVTASQTSAVATGSSTGATCSTVTGSSLTTGSSDAASSATWAGSATSAGSLVGPGAVSSAGSTSASRATATEASPTLPGVAVVAVMISESGSAEI